MLFVTGWLQALTISYLIGSFEIMMMPKDIFFLVRLWQKKNQNKFSISFGSELKLIYNKLRTV